MSSNIKQMESLILNLMRETKTPGMCIGIVRKNKSIYSKGFGVRDVMELLPMTPDTLFGIGSISKSFTATAIMQLFERGMIDLQSPVKKYLDFQLGSDENPILVHHLLSHSTGISDLDSGAMVEYRREQMAETIVSIANWGELLHYINGAKGQIASLPGQLFMYSNDMYSLLAYLVEKVSGIKFGEYMKKNIFLPLGMEKTTYEFKKAQNVVTGYNLSPDGKKLLEVSHPFHELKFGRGGIFSTCKEMQNYLLMLINEGKSPMGDSQIISIDSLRAMWTPHIKTPEESSYGDAYGYGWSINSNFLGNELITHGGSIGTTGGYIAFLPKLQMGIIVGQNGTPQICGQIAKGILGTLLGGDLNKIVPMLKIQEKMKMLEGRYEGYKNLTRAEVKLKEGILQGKLFFVGNPNPMEFCAAPYDLENLIFYIPIVYPNNKIWLNFMIDENGGVHLQADRYYLHKVSNI